MTDRINTENKYFIISLSHTMRHEKYITFWRPNNAGYCYSKEMAGLYDGYNPGYHDSESLPILKEDVDKLFIPCPYDGENKMMVLNHQVIWDILGVKMTRNGLVKK